MTETGTETFGYAEEIFSLGNELESYLKNNRQQRQMVFRVGVADVMPKLMIYRLLSPALEGTDGVRVVCTESTFDALIKDLATHKLDLVLADRRLDPDTNIKAYNHALGASGVTFFAHRSLYRPLKKHFPQSLNHTPMLLPTSNTALRRSIDLWFEENQIVPLITGEFDDSALLKVFGQAGMGAFCAPSVIEEEVLKQYDVNVIGRTTAIQEKFFAITAERKIKHPVVSRLRDTAQSMLTTAP